MMRFRTAVTLAIYIGVCSTLTVWSIQFPAQATSISKPPEASTVSGTIAAFGNADFTLELLRNQKPNKLQFAIDSNTSIEGKLTVGVRASVDYRAEGERLIATRVVVLPASGIGQE